MMAAMVETLAGCGTLKPDVEMCTGDVRGRIQSDPGAFVETVHPVDERRGVDLRVHVEAGEPRESVRWRDVELRLANLDGTASSRCQLTAGRRNPLDGRI